MQIDIDGNGPPLVLVHSLLTDAQAFGPVVPRLAARRRVIRVSLPGFGTTPALPMEEPSLFDLADLVAEAMTEADAGNDAAVLGNGLGAFVCVALAIEHGHRFGPLILANGGAVFADERKEGFTTMSGLVTNGGMEAVVDVAVRRIFPESYLEAHPEVIDERREVLLQTDPVPFSAACLALRDMDLRPSLPRITNPTLVIAGGADQTTPPEMAQELAAGVPDAELVELDGCGHCPPLEQPEAFISTVEAFLDRVALGAGKPAEPA